MAQRIYYLLSFVFLFTQIINGQKANNPPETVKYVDLKKYVGLWYEIAKIPNKFQSDCARSTTAEYKLKEDGKIEVINSCIEADGEKNIAEGIAEVVDKSTNAKLEVSFFSILGIRPFWGDYWILGLGEDYEYAVIGGPDRKYGWILSKTPTLPEEKLSRAFDILKSQGYNPERFTKTLQ